MARWGSGMTLILRLAAALLVALASMAHARNSPNEPLKQFDIPEQPLSQALLEFSKQADIILTVPSHLVSDKTAPPVLGELTPSSALLQLLEGSGLQAVFTASGAVTIGQPARYSTVLEEVMVTAQKRTENMQTVPSSVSAITNQRLRSLHARSITDYAAYIPGLNVSSGGSPGQTTITMRGIAPVGPGAVVGFYVGDTPLGSSSNYGSAREYGLDLMPYDVERIEVLRGPQGTLYGAGAMGGLLKYVLREPELTQLQASAGIETSTTSDADDPGWGVRAGLNVPLIAERLALWTSYFKQDTPGYIDNALTGWQDENGVIQQGGRAALLWQINSSATLQLGGLWQRIDSAGDATATLALTGLDPPTGVASLGDLISVHPLREPFEKSIDLYSATLEWDLGGARFTSATGYSTTRTRSIEDASFIFGMLYPLLSDGEVEQGLAPFHISLDLRKWTQELRLTSTGSSRFDWMVGAFYTQEDSEHRQVITALDGRGQSIERFAPVFVHAAFPSKYQEQALFGSATLPLSRRFDITAGVRWARNEQHFRQISGGQTAVIGPAYDEPGESAESVFTYMLSPRWKLDEDTMVYARVATGYRPGGPNPVVFNLPPTTRADTLINYEVGFKSDLLKRRALLNLAAFYIDWDDIQQSVFVGGIAGIDNAGKARSQGLELELSYSPWERLRIDVGAAYTDATLRSSPPAMGLKNGSRLIDVPEWSASLVIDYEMPLAAHWLAHFGAGYRYVGDQESGTVTVTNNSSYVRPAYRALDMYADLTRGRWSLRAFARNVTDERGLVGGGAAVNGLNIPYAIEVQTLQPRTVGLALDVSF